MNIHRSILATSILLCAFLNVAAQDAPAPPPAESAPPAPAAPADPAQNEPRTLEEIFIPSDEIAADEEVTFPVNI